MSSISSLLADHVSLRLSCVDRLICQGYIVGLQSEGMVVRFSQHRGCFIPIPSGLGEIHDRMVNDLKPLWPSRHPAHPHGQGGDGGPAGG
jgi:hypothetical protein